MQHSFTTMVYLRKDNRLHVVAITTWVDYFGSSTRVNYAEHRAQIRNMVAKQIGDPQSEMNTREGILLDWNNPLHKKVSKQCST